MGFDEIVRRVATRLNLTSPEAFQRIGDRVNSRYKRVTSSIGMITSRRQVKDYTVGSTLPITLLPNTTIPLHITTLPDITIPSFEKVLRLYTRPITGGNASSILVLKQLTFDEIKNQNNFLDREPRAYAIKRMGSREVTISLDSFPNTTAFPLGVEGYDIADILADDAEPFLPEDYHFILEEGAMSDELRKMEKPELAQMAEQKFQDGLSDLRMFISKNAYQDIAQGRDKPSQLWYRPWFSRVSMWD